MLRDHPRLKHLEFSSGLLIQYCFYYIIIIYHFQFRFADCWDRLFMIVGSLFAAANGVALPAMIIVFGDMIDMFVDTGIYTAFLDDISAFLASVNQTKEAMLADASLLQ